MTRRSAPLAPTTAIRDGFVIGEGAGVVVLETYEHAQEPRRADLCRACRLRIVGRRPSHHGAAQDGDGALRCMNAAIKRAGIAAAEIDYINAHGT